MAIKGKIPVPNSTIEFEFFSDSDNLEHGNVFEFEGQKYLVNNLPTNHYVSEDGVDLVETRFKAVKAL